MWDAPVERTPRSEFQLRSLAGPVYLPTFLFALGMGAVVPVIPLFARDLGAGIMVFLVAETLQTSGSSPPGNGAKQRAEEDS